MSRKLTFAYPGALDTKTGGYAYDRRVIDALEALGWQVEKRSLGHGFPDPGTTVLENADKALSALPDGALVIVDGLAFGVLDRWAERDGERLKIVALVHHPLALETGLTQQQIAQFHEAEKRALRHARHVVVTSPATACTLCEDYAVSRERITIAVPGIDPVEQSDCSQQDLHHILSVGSLTRRKGHDVLVSALKAVEDLQWTATIVGSHKLDPVTADALEGQVRDMGLSDRITITGEVEDTAPYFARAGLFALASHYEGYGMVFAEALAYGLPVVGCRAGAVTDVVPEEAGILVPPNDVAAFADALRVMLKDQSQARKKAAAARVAGRKLPDWPETGRRISIALEALQ